MADNTVHGTADRATGSPAFVNSARAGYGVSGLLHLLIAYIVLRLSFATAGDADQSGAIATLAAQPGGAVALWVVMVGLAALALWRPAESVVGSHPNEPGHSDTGAMKTFTRIKSIALAVAYAGIAITAVRFATGGGKSNSADNVSLTARLLQSGWGKAVLLVAAVAIMAVGGYHIYKGLSQKFEDDLLVSGNRAVTVLGTIGYVAKGVVLGGAGALLVAAALGFAAYGAYCFVLARFARM